MNLEIGSLWIKQGQKGQFLSGKIGELPIVGFYETNKKNPNQPDIRIYVDVKGIEYTLQKRQERYQGNGGGYQAPQPHYQAQPQYTPQQPAPVDFNYPSEQISPEDIPF